MTKKILLALVVIALAAVPAFASVQNIKVGGSIDSTYLVRDQFSLITEGDNQNLFLTQTTLRVDADLSENVSATVALLNERVWGEEAQTAEDNDIDLNLAFVTLREMLYSPLTVVVGRQSFAYGNSFIVDSGGTNNNISGASGLSGVAEDLTLRTAQDAVRLIFDYNPLTVELLASKIDSNINVTTGAQNDDVNLLGTNLNYKLGDSWDSVVESYFFARIDRSTGIDGSTDGLKADTLYVPGLRASTNPIKGLNVQGEVAGQFGNKATTHTAGTARVDNQDRGALGAQLITNYMLPFEQLAKWSPVVTGVYTYTTGDKNPDYTGAQSDDYHGWDPLFENQASGTVYNTLFDLTNSHIVMASAQVNPIEDLTTKVTGTWLWLDKSVTDGTPGNNCFGTSCPFKMRQPNTAAGISNPAVTTNKTIGYEVDVDLAYDYTEDVQIGLNMGWFTPGEFFTAANNEVASQYLANVDVKF
ncbi:MAG: hypothetical protein A2Z88_04185 [Omnitrophica WOR_2 bacterium GWA2_47_8]|nr:MAG: hypothetical protein A2Z88_04185 [Omnitrophica WOR_2 bacterium GWA2_47_8]